LATITTQKFELSNLGVLLDPDNCKYDFKDWLFGMTCSSPSIFSETWFKNNGFDSVPTDE